jgi:hypothetical protein
MRNSLGIWEHHWEHFGTGWEHDGNTRIKKLHPHTLPLPLPSRKKDEPSKVYVPVLSSY